MDRLDLLPGQKWEHAIRQAIEESSYFIILLSKNSVSKRGFIHKELKIALDLLDNYAPSDIFIIPARIDEVRPTDKRLLGLHWVDLFPSYKEGLEKILQVLIPSEDIETIKKTEQIAEKPICFAIVSSKGGTGKSIITASIGYILSHCGFKTLLVDMDLFTHGLSFYLLTANAAKPSISLIDIFSENNSIDSVMHTPLSDKYVNDNLYILPSIGRKRQAKAELHVSQRFNDLDAFRKRVLEIIPQHNFDYIIFDTRGGTDHTSIGTAQAAGSFIMVTEADKPSWDMGSLFFDTIEDIKNEKDIIRSGFIINKNVLPSEAIETFLRKEWGAPHIATIPLDESAIRYFQEDKVPVAMDIGSPFSIEILKVINKLFVSKKWTAGNMNKLKILEDSANKISAARKNEIKTSKRAEKFSIILRLYGTITATALLAFSAVFQFTGRDIKLNQTFIIIAALLIFFMTISDPKILKMYLDTLIRLLRKK